MGLKRLKSTLPTLGGTVRILDVTPGSTKRLKGPKYQGVDGRNTRWLIYHPICAVCIAEGAGDDARPAVAVDHIVPLWEAGPDDETNLQSICKPHHDVKTAEETKRRNNLMRSGWLG